MSSSSERELSEGSNLESQTTGETPSSSPSQQVPNLSVISKPTTSVDDVSMHKDDNRPRLRVIEQPQQHFRFRYKSERECGSHGCLMGYNNTNSSKTYPTVELVNYTGPALVKCRLFTEDKTCEHPHQLLENDQDNCYSTIVPEQGSYKVCFRGMGIIHTAKKDVQNALVEKRLERTPNANRREIVKQCKQQANSINLNVVVLRFSAHDISTDTEICSEYSWPISNMKSVATNPLKICRYSRTSGRRRGGDDVFLLVDKISKKNIKVRMFELDAENQVIWREWANFLESDVHHQHAIVIRTPAYDGPTIAAKVNVFIELVRTTDGQTSAPVEFFYTDPNFAQTKKRKIDFSPSSSQCSTGSSSLIASIPPTPRVFVRSQYCDRRVDAEASDTSGQGPQQTGFLLSPSGILGSQQSSDPISHTLGVVGQRLTSTQSSRTSGVLGLPQTSGERFQTGVIRPQQTDSHISQTSGFSNPSGTQHTSAPLSQSAEVLWPQQSNAQLSQSAGVVGAYRTRPQVSQTGSLQFPLQSGLQFQQTHPVHRRNSPYHSGENHQSAAQEMTHMLLSESDENSYNFFSRGVAIEETQRQYHDPEDIKMIITGSTVSENVTHEYSVLSVPPDGSYNPDLDDRSELMSTNDPMMGQGHPNVIDPLAILQASNLGGDQAEFEQFQSMYTQAFDVSQFQFDKADSGVPKKNTVGDGHIDFSRELQSHSMKPSCLGLKTEPSVNRGHSEVSNFLDDNKESDERPAFKPEDFIRVKKLIKEIYEILKNGNEYSVALRKKLEQLCEIRMSNRDTFLHMTLTHNQPNFEPIVNVIHSMKMPYLLNLTNDRQQTILHLAVIHDQPRLVAFLIAKGCDPNMEDYEGNNVIHNAVIHQSSLESILDAIKSNNVAFNLEAFNYEMQTALHLAAIYDSESSARLLLKHGASYNARDSEGRTPLHLATYDDYLGVTRALLDSVLPIDVDAVDRAGRTALQIACGGDIRKNTLEIIKLLLEKGADPFKQDGNKSAMELAKRRTEMWKVMDERIRWLRMKNANDSEPEDEFLSADEGKHNPISSAGDRRRIWPTLPALARRVGEA